MWNETKKNSKKKINKSNQEFKILPLKYNIQIMVPENVTSIMRGEGEDY